MEPLLSIEPLCPLLMDPLELVLWPELPLALPLAEPSDVCAKQPNANIIVIAIITLFNLVLLKNATQSWM